MHSETPVGDQAEGHEALNPGHIRTSGAEWLFIARILEGEMVFVSADDYVVDNERS